MTATSQSGHRWVYRWPRAHLVRTLGRLVVGLGALWLVVSVVVAVADASGAVAYGVLVVLSLVVLAIAGYLVAVPPAVLELSDQGYRIRNVRAAGTASAAWKDVRSVSTGESVAGPVLVLEGNGRAPSVVPLELLGPRAAEVEARVGELLDAAHGRRPL